MQNFNIEATAEFNREVRSWAFKVISAIRMQDKTHGSGKLMRSLQPAFYDNDRSHAISGIAFRFEPYGIFVHYGVGRGYISDNGVLKRGHRIQKGSALWNKMRRKGDSPKSIRKMSVVSDFLALKRSPINWIDKYIEKHNIQLANTAAEYYADSAAWVILRNLSKSKIDKNG